MNGTDNTVGGFGEKRRTTLLFEEDIKKMYGHHLCVSIFGGGRLKPTYCGHCHASFVASDNGVIMCVGFQPHRNPLGQWQFS